MPLARIHPYLDMAKHIDTPRSDIYNPGEDRAPFLGNARTANNKLKALGALLVKVKEDPRASLLEKYNSVRMGAFVDELSKIAGGDDEERSFILRSLLMAALGKTENTALSVDGLARERTMFGDMSHHPNYNQRVQEYATHQSMMDSRLQAMQGSVGSMRSVF